MSSSALFKIFDGGSNSDEVRLRELHRELARNESRIQHERQMMKERQRELSFQKRIKMKQLQKAIVREDPTSAEIYAEDIAEAQREINDLRQAQRPLMKAQRATAFARQSTAINSMVSDTLDSITKVNATVGLQKAMKAHPSAMRQGQILKSTTDQFKNATQELQDALECSDDEDDEMESEASLAMERDPSSVHTSTNPRMILKYMEDTKYLMTQESMGMHSIRESRSNVSDDDEQEVQEYGLVDR